ncbi:TIM-barrel domain-containing protein [Paenibacillus hodogayensis]|uniref:TIM-barrel domain-containing protein n=1 Tax=Paenibacillus hodogayensis TaxID=279208 RepID=A0ABV5W061_9BACL
MKERHVDVPLHHGGIVRVEPVSERIFRIRLGTHTRFAEAALVKYGVVRSEWAPVPFELEEREDAVTIRTVEAAVTVSRGDGRVTFSDGDGLELLRETESPNSSAESGFAAEFSLADDEKLYGLGDESRVGLQKRGHRAKMWVKNVDCYSPIPFLYSNKGWGLFLNTTWRHFFDLGHSKPDRWRLFARNGELDYYLIAGKDYGQLLDGYTDITGKPQMLPIWAYGLTFVCNQQANAREMLDDAMSFRREGIPCDLIGLEPGWMEKNYDYSTGKKWHPDRFYIPGWAPVGQQTFVGALERLGFKLSLWLCSDYDITYHEEKLAGERAQASGNEQESGDYHPDDFEQDLRAHAPVYMDQLTKRDEPWFRHLTPFVDQGVKAFKMDGARQVNEHPDRKWGNGMDDEEMHNAYPVLLNKQMHEGFREHGGLRPMIYTSGGYAGIQRYAATWAGDTGGGPKPLVSMLAHGMTGHANASCDMDVFTPQGIHFGFLQPWSQVNSWAYWRHPWLLGENLLPMFKAYAKLRYRLLPYIYSAAHVAAQTAMPIIRAMPLAYPDDPRCDELTQQYMFGPSMLVAAFTNEVHLPEGEWIDYWSGERYVGPADVTADVPGDRGGPLFIKAGAILPLWPEMDYVGHKPVDTIGLHLYPHGSSEFTLYEDDGTTFRYAGGEIAVTRITSEADDREIRIVIEPREGCYENMPEQRSFELGIHAGAAPSEVLLQGRRLDSGKDWHYADGIIRLTVHEAADRSHSIELRCLSALSGC